MALCRRPAIITKRATRALWTRADLSGHVEAMLEATGVLEMGEAARCLRSDAARIVRLLNRAQPLAGPLVPCPALVPSSSRKN